MLFGGEEGLIRLEYGVDVETVAASIVNGAWLHDQEAFYATDLGVELIQLFRLLLDVQAQSSLRLSLEEREFRRSDLGWDVDPVGAAQVVGEKVGSGVLVQPVAAWDTAGEICDLSPVFLIQPLIRMPSKHVSLEGLLRIQSGVTNCASMALIGVDVVGHGEWVLVCRRILESEESVTRISARVWEDDQGALVSLMF